jgi:hypothetical protein
MVDALDWMLDVRSIILSEDDGTAASYMLWQISSTNHVPLKYRQVD